MQVQLTEQQKSQATALGIDWKKLFDNLPQLIALLVSIFGKPVMQAKPGHEDVHAACCKCVCSTAQALSDALECHKTCCQA